MNTLKQSLLVLSLILLPFARVGAATITVTNISDSNPGSLRSAVASALAGDTIIFGAGLSGQTITLSNGQITLSVDVTIDGSALANRIQINGNHATRILQVASGTTVTLNSLTLTNAYAASVNGGGIFSGGALTVTNCILAGNSAGGSGGGIYNGGTLTVNGSVLAGNSAGTSGGGIISSGMLTVNNCSLEGNSANDSGGGIFNGDTLTINNSTLAGNSAGSTGGGIYNSDTLTLNQSTVSTNTASIYGGGIENNGTLGVNQCTFFGNSAGGGGAIDNNSSLTAIQSTLFGNWTTSDGDDGGAIWAGGSVVMTNCTVVGNAAPSGTTAGIAQYGGAPILIVNSIVALNTNGNVGGSFSGNSNLTSGDPLLAALGNYSGPTQTMPPLSGSPAVDAGNDTVTNSFATDQRGFPRRSGLHVDIGAAERQVSVATNPPVLAGLKRLGNGSFRFDFTNQTGASFTVFGSTNVARPLNTWSNLGPVLEVPASSGHFQFTDPQATNNPQRFYRVRSP